MKYTSKDRRTWISRYREIGNVSLVCAEFNISRVTFYKWLNRADPEHPAKPLRSESRRPKSKRLPRKWGSRELNILADTDFKTRGRLSAVRLSELLEKRGVTLSRSTVGRMMRNLANQCPVCGQRRRVHNELAHYAHEDMAIREGQKNLMQHAMAQSFGDGATLSLESPASINCQAKVKGGYRQCRNQARAGSPFCKDHQSRIAATEGLSRN